MKTKEDPLAAAARWTHDTTAVNKKLFPSSMGEEDDNEKAAPPVGGDEFNRANSMIRLDSTSALLSVDPGANSWRLRLMQLRALYPGGGGNASGNQFSRHLYFYFSLSPILLLAENAHLCFVDPCYIIRQRSSAG